MRYCDYFGGGSSPPIHPLIALVDEIRYNGERRVTKEINHVRLAKEVFQEKPEPKSVAEEQGGGMTLSLEKILQRFDLKASLPSAVRAQAIKTLTAMSGREIHMAVATGNVKLARQIGDTLQRVEKDFPRVIERMTREEKSALSNQRDRAVVRVARLENKLVGSDGKESPYGITPDPNTQVRKDKLKEK